MQFDLYVRRDSWLHRLDPRTKIWLAAVGLGLGLVTNALPVLAALLIGFQLLLLSARIPPDRLGWLWKRMLPLTVLILILQPFFSSGAGGELLWQLGPLRWTSAGVLTAAGFALRVNGMAFAAATLLFTTDPTALVRGLVKLGLPYEWGLTVSLALRYLPTTYGLYQSIYEAQQARGWDPARGGLLRRVRSYLPMLVAVMIAALRMADNLGLALAARGFGATYGAADSSPAVHGARTTLRDIRFGRLDWAVTAAGAAVLVAALVWLRLSQAR
jgi:energy-coupling factor transport system permease protein